MEEDKMNIYRHGDLLIKQVKKMPKNLIRSDNKILALGEATGHKHELEGDCEVFENQTGKYFIAHNTSLLFHEEHNAIEIDEGIYRVINEREYNPTLKRSFRVLD